MTHVRYAPDEICLIVFPARTPDIETATGTFDIAVNPLPNVPCVPFPQQYAFPPESTTQTFSKPTETCLIFFPARTPDVETATGTFD